jgi:hypothetical protein
MLADQPKVAEIVCLAAFSLQLWDFIGFSIDESSSESE